MTIENSLDNFIQRYTEFYQKQQVTLEVEFESDWISPCLSSDPDVDGMARWRPVRREGSANFEQTEQALELNFHADLKAFYSRYWSNGLDAKTDRGQLQLIQPWNEEDFDRLQQNLVGHVLMKKRLRQPITLFFAVTDDDDFILSLDNQSGEVMLEQVGLEPREVLAPNLSEFLDNLAPVLP